MPNYKNHERINLFVLCCVDAALIYFKIDLWMVGLFSVSYLIATFLISPDLDLDSRIYNRWGFLKYIWWPYKELFKHRQSSHHIIFGPLSLWLYSATLIFIVVYLLQLNIDVSPETIIVLSLGLVVATECHIIADWMT